MAESALAIDSALHAGSAALESAAAGAWPPLALASFGGALLASWLLTPASARLGQVLGLIDRPDATRKLHQGDIPRSGGIAVALAFYGVVLGGWIIGPWLAHLLGGALDAGASHFLANAREIAWPAAGLLGGGLILFFLGLADDRLDLPAKPKLFVQILCAVLLCASGVRAKAFLPEPMGWLLSVVWVVALCNAFNFLDNSDGLASGVAGLAAIAFALLSWQAGEWLMMAVWAALAGAVGGFWLRNFFFGRPFLGDGGALMLGFLIGGLALRGTYYEPGAPTGLPVLTPLILLGLPIFDAASVLWLRWREGRPLMKGDRRHLSHRLVDIGFSTRGAVLAHYLIVAACGLIAWALRTAPRGPALGLLGVVALLFWFLYLLEQAASRRMRALAAEINGQTAGASEGTRHERQTNSGKPASDQRAPARGAPSRGHHRQDALGHRSRPAASPGQARRNRRGSRSRP